jgi:ribosomal protein S2
MANKVEVKELLDAGVHFGHLQEDGTQTWPHISIWNAMGFTS